MSGWIMWVIVGAAFGIGEMLTRRFFLAPLAIAAILAAAADAVVGGLVSWVVFIICTVLSLVLVRSIVRAHRTLPAELRTGAAALVGKQAVVLERIANHEGVGCVRVEGELWTARSLFEDQVIEPGVVVDVVQIKGATALVRE